MGTPSFWNHRLENSFWTHTLPSAVWKDRPVHDGQRCGQVPAWSLSVSWALGPALYPLCIKCETRGITASVFPSSTTKWRKMNQKGESSVGSHGRQRRQTCCVGFIWPKVQSCPELLKGTCDSKERRAQSWPWAPVHPAHSTVPCACPALSPEPTDPTNTKASWGSHRVKRPLCFRAVILKCSCHVVLIL